MNDPNTTTFDQHPDTGTEERDDRQYFRVTIRAPIHKVWAEITRTDKLLPFFLQQRLQDTRARCRRPDSDAVKER